jgi:hypothetical protein
MLQEADFDHRAFANRTSEDDRLYVQFYVAPFKDDAATAAEGRPIYKDVEFIRIQQPGNLLSRIERPVRETDAARFPKQYAAFQAGKEDQNTGTPLAEWPLMTRAQVEELKYFRVFTVEQLAELDENSVQKMMGGQTMKTKAKDWLDRAGGNKIVNELRDQNTKLQLQIDELQAAIRNLSQEKQKGK